MSTNIAIEELTDGALDANNEWVGTGIFDKLIDAVNKNIEGQYNKGRIDGKDYAEVYLGSMQSVIAQSMQYVLQEKLAEAQVDSEIVNRYNTGDKMLAEAVTKYGYVGAMIDANGKVTLGTRSATEGSTNKQDDVLEAQKDLYTRQKEAFDDNKYQKLFEAQLNYNGMVFQDADNPDVLDIALESKVADIYNRITGKDLNIQTAAE